jgi:AraC family transcriptional regulator
VTLAELVHAAGVHRAQLARAFQARHGVSVGTYVRRERIYWAARTLRSTGTPIAEIALQAGFADQSHFTRTFVKHMGVSPGLYRRSVRR